MMSGRSVPLFLGTLALAFAAAPARAETHEPWRVESYTDEAGYQSRIAGMVERIGRVPFLERSMAVSKCPDTGLTVRTWALEGETILSPYTGRAYRQGPTGYFGPKARDTDGRISAFGGDPLKVALPHATAALLSPSVRTSAGGPGVDPAVVRAYLSIPGNLRQQYHFAAVNWVRHLGTAGPLMPPEWHTALRQAVATYEENRRPSDGAVREYQPLPRTETLIGIEGELLGGGGTENHKTMWRSAGLLYGQLFPPGSLISGVPAEEAVRLTSSQFIDYVRRLFVLGNGEYHSSTYYPYSFRAFANLYDFSPDASTRAWAQAALDFYFATYGLKVFNGVVTGAQRRGWVDGHVLGEMDAHLHAWVPRTTVPVDSAQWVTSLHQATSRYRPNRVISRLIAKDVPLPFEAEIAHPDYGMEKPNRHSESLYVSPSFALGSVQLDLVNNSAQQTTWSLNVRGPQGSLIFGGGQPRWTHPEGHSPYDQWIQKRGSLLFMTGATVAPPGESAPQRYATGKLEGPKGYSRLAAFSGPRDPAERPAGPLAPAELQAYFERARTAEATWLFIPRDPAARILPADAAGRWVVEMPETWAVITPFGQGQPFWLESTPDGTPTPASRLLERYRVLVIPGSLSGFALEAVERTQASTPAAATASSLTIRGSTAQYRSRSGDELTLEYQPSALRPKAHINGSQVDWSRWADGGVYASPHLRIKDGRMWISDGREAYTLDFTGQAPVWQVSRP